MRPPTTCEKSSRTHGKVLRVTLERATAIKVIKLPANNDAQVKLYLQEVDMMFTMDSKVHE